MADMRELDRRAVETSRSLVHTVASDTLGRATPCADWDLAALLAHMTVQHHGFAMAVSGRTTDLGDWRPVPADDPVAAYDAAADHVIEAFASPADLAYLPEIRGGLTVPSRIAVGFHFVDYVVHSWDVAATLGVPVEFDDEVLAAALTVAAQVPDDAATRGPGLSFAPALAVADDGPPLHRVLRMLGRSPDWHHTA